MSEMARDAWTHGYGIFERHVCERCDGTGITEEPVYGRFAAEATRPVPCPKCRPNAAREQRTAVLDADASAAREANRGWWRAA